MTVALEQPFLSHMDKYPVIDYYNLKAENLKKAKIKAENKFVTKYEIENYETFYCKKDNRHFILIKTK